jgi:hypothetical protein
MSLIRARRERRELGGSGPKRPLPLGRLLLLLLLVLGLIWWLDRIIN